METRELQRRLKELKLYTGKLDGDAGPLTETAVRAFLLNQRVDAPSNWSFARRIIAAEQAIYRLDGIEVGTIDGLIGPQTRYAREAYEARKKEGAWSGEASTVETWRDDIKGKAKAPAAAKVWPTQSQVPKFFGPVGANQTTLVFPYPMRLAWNTSTIVRQTSCHEKIHDAARRALEKTADHYGLEAIKRLGLDLFGGCLNVRKMRGGSAWSMHSWGIAFDFDPANNQLKWGRDRARMAGAEYSRFLDFWEEEGAISLGRARNFDWMHVQFARL